MNIPNEYRTEKILPVNDVALKKKTKLISKSHSNKMAQHYGFLLLCHYAMSRNSNTHTFAHMRAKIHKLAPTFDLKA